MAKTTPYATETEEDPEKVQVIQTTSAAPAKQGSCGKKLAIGGGAAALIGGIIVLIVVLAGGDDSAAGVVEAPAPPPPGGGTTPSPPPAVPFADVEVTFSNSMADDTAAWRAQLIATAAASVGVPEAQVEIAAVQPGSVTVTFRFLDGAAGSQTAVASAKAMSEQLSAGTGVMTAPEFSCCVVRHERRCASGDAGATALPALADGATLTGTQVLPPAGSNTLVLLSKAGLPAGRSYDGHAWEGVMPTPLTFDCCSADGAGACEVVLPSGTFDVAVIETDGPSANQNDKDAARFLLQSTFGPTAAEIASMAGSSAATTRANIEQWVEAQMAETPTSHREYYRKRTNPRLPAPLSSGGVRTPCSAGSRWHRFAFTAADVGRTIVAASNGAGFDLTVGGVLRTTVASFNPGAGNHVVCDAVEDIDAEVKLGTSAADCDDDSSTSTQTITNPSITAPQADKTQAFGAGDATFVYYANANGGKIGTARRGAERTADGMPFGLLQSVTGCTLPSEGDAFMTLDGATYKHDPRLQLIDNTVAQPATESAGTVCPTVTRNFLNMDGCVRAETCAPTRYASKNIELNDATLRNFYTNGGSYVYKVDNLRLEDSYADSPCDAETVSRWKKTAGACSAETGLDASTLTTIRNAITAATGVLVRDVELMPSGGSGTCNDMGSGDQFGYSVTVGGSDCWQHVHPDTLNVYDFSYWALHHPGNEDILKLGRSNPITAFAAAGGVELTFPSTHLMNRWSKHTCVSPPCDTHAYIMLIGRAGDTVDFAALPNSVQTPEFATSINALVQNDDLTTTGTEACGSYGEVANDPSLGNRYHSFLTIDDDYRIDETTDYLTHQYRVQNGKMMVWQMVALNSPDQLRQRMAWALAQIYLLGENGYPKQKEIETWTVFYDIFVRNAFGNLRDILRAVSWSPQMGRYLTFRRSSGFCPGNGCSYPDENYAREFMQLFTIGLWKLNDDGTVQLDESGDKVPTYSNSDIMTFARAWTGFDDQPARGNIEHYIGDNSDNFVDPSKLKPEWRDFLPKMDLYGGHLGDTYPLCADLPDKAWLRKGAEFRYLGRSPEPRTSAGVVPGVGSSSMLPLRPDRVPALEIVAASGLFAPLCDRPSASAACRHPTSVTLSQHLTCTGTECDVEAPQILKVVDGANDPIYYEYHPAPCVSTPFYADAKQIKWTMWRDVVCADPKVAAAGASCCVDGATTNSFASGMCKFTRERVTFATAQARCEAESPAQSVCNRFNRVCPQDGDKVDRDSTHPDNPTDVTGWHCDYHREYTWMNRPCKIQVQVYESGQINIKHGGTPTDKDDIAADGDDGDIDDRDDQSAWFKGDFKNHFKVGWKDGNFPYGSSCTGDACALDDDGESCVCDTTVQETPVFVDSSSVPTRQQVLDQLHIGSTPPDTFDAGTYTLCATAACQAAQGVEVWTRDGSFDMTTIFKVVVKDKTLWLLNKESTVHIGSSFEFRNPPHFMKFHDVTVRDAAYETEALIDHMFYHDNTAPFISHRLIQRFVTSNPSPRYVKTVAQAFRTGSYNGQTYSGKYGDLGAALAAILLDREAQAAILELDPNHGRLREPILKLIHLMRSMEFESKNGHEIELYWTQSRIGQNPYQSPSVFNFYLPEYMPMGPVADRLLVAPEAELATAPFIIQALNGMFSLINNGLTSCMSGFGTSKAQRTCSCGSAADCKRRETASGELTFTPTSTDAAGAVSELDMLLTGGRLNARSREIIEREYNDALALEQSDLQGASGLPIDGVRRAMQLIVGAAEFHSTQANVLKSQERPPPTVVPSQDRPYKATVVIYLKGGADTFNLLVPHSGCTANSNKDMNDEYQTVRAEVAMPKNQLLQIDVPAGTQPCTKFGLHPDLDYLEELYEDGDGSFISNIGNLIEPITVAEYKAKTKQIPLGLFAHNTQVEHSQSVHPQAGDAKGVLGRIVGALTSQTNPYKTKSYSITGSMKIVEGPNPAEIISAKSGAVRLQAFDSQANGRLGAPLLNMSSIESSTIFSETWSGLLESSLENTESLGADLDAATVTETFDEESNLCNMLKQVAKIISLSQGADSPLDSERDVFVVNLGGFDTHSDLIEDFSANMADLNGCVESFVKEIKRTPGLWDGVAITTLSDFGRTITSNGIGTDHGWGGNHILLGGGVSGGKIHGHYPDDLTEAGPQMLSRGRLIPTTPWEGLWHGVAEWMGVDASKMTELLPNMGNFVRETTLFTKEQLFD